MILSNTDIHKALDDGRLVITPEPRPRRPASSSPAHCPYDTHSVDLTLADEIAIPQSVRINIDLTASGTVADTIERNSDRIVLTRQQPFCLQPHQFVLGRTCERIELPLQKKSGLSLAARIEGKSSLARFGLLVHFTAPTVHPGFVGTLTLEMINLGPVPLQLVPGMAIAQLIIEQVSGRPVRNPSQFQGQSSPAGRSRIEEKGSDGSPHAAPLRKISPGAKKPPTRRR